MCDVIQAQAEGLADLLPRINRRLLTIDSEDPAVELPVAQLRVCSILQDGPKAMSALSKEMGISLSAVTQIVDRLGKTGLVDRFAEPADRRVKCLRLTEHGVAVMKARRHRRAGRILSLLQLLSYGERRSLVAGLQALYKVAESANGNGGPA